MYEKEWILGYVYFVLGKQSLYYTSKQYQIRLVVCYNKTQLLLHACFVIVGLQTMQKALRGPTTRVTNAGDTYPVGTDLQNFLQGIVIPTLNNTKSNFN